MKRVWREVLGLHDALGLQHLCTLISIELAAKISLGKKSLFEFDVAVFISSVHEVGDLLSKYESCHMDPEQRNMLLDMKSLSQEIFSDWVSTHGAVIVSALRHFSPDWSGIVDTEAFRTKAREGMQELEGLKALSEAVCKQLDGPKAEDQRLVFLKDEPCQSHFRWWAAWLHCALNLRAAHLRSVDKLHEVKIVSDLQQVFARYNALNGHKSIEWAFQRDGVTPSSRDPLWRRKPLVSKDDPSGSMTSWRTIIKPGKRRWNIAEILPTLISSSRWGTTVSVRTKGSSAQ